MSISINQHGVESITLGCEDNWIDLWVKDKDGNIMEITFFTRTIADDGDDKKLEILYDLQAQIRRALRDE